MRERERDELEAAIAARRELGDELGEIVMWLAIVAVNLRR